MKLPSITSKISAHAYLEPIMKREQYFADEIYTNLYIAINFLDCKTVGFFLKISKEIGNAWRKSLMRANIASLPSLALCFQPLTAHAYLNTQKYGLFCSL